MTRDILEIMESENSDSPEFQKAFKALQVVHSNAVDKCIDLIPQISFIGKATGVLLLLCLAFAHEGKAPINNIVALVFFLYVVNCRLIKSFHQANQYTKRLNTIAEINLLSQFHQYDALRTDHPPLPAITSDDLEDEQLFSYINKWERVFNLR